MLYSYVPSLVKVRLFGIELEGLSKESFVTIERIDPTNTFRKALDGNRTVFIDRYATYRVTVNVSQVSETNEFLHTIYKLYLKTGANFKIPLEIEERNKWGGTSFQATDVYFETEPSSDFGSEAMDRSWTFICHGGGYNLKGTSDAGFITDALRSSIWMIDMATAFGLDLSNVLELVEKGARESEQRLKDLFKGVV